MERKGRRVAGERVRFTWLVTVCWVTGEEGGDVEGEDCCWLCPAEGELEGEELDPEEGDELEPEWRCCCSMFCTFCSFFSWLASCCWRSLFTCTMPASPHHGSVHFRQQ